MRPDRRARSLSEGCRCVHGSKTEGRSSGRSEESPGPARPTTESPSACRYSQSQATPARRPATEPKIGGLLALGSILKPAALDFFVVFSSTSAIFAPPLQTSYSAANAAMEAGGHDGIRMGS